MLSPYVYTLEGSHLPGNTRVSPEQMASSALDAAAEVAVDRDADRVLLRPCLDRE